MTPVFKTINHLIVFQVGLMEKSIIDEQLFTALEVPVLLYKGNRKFKIKK
ncbi:hypothetical protein Niako_6136 [Niastella koreensis GR20-10]|uniref:Uncharacterized protein n=1 Tax=Niastella koreensis (strain DSM 17620 / KACC 11465 / NBRC 106392 / GR20-10) TaxID=700598 RepID=G8T904_NIAKG|nr:hypothetical protein Niako_6136 [Niastella koreensis GR20-10]